jgi:hypothetical protein
MADLANYAKQHVPKEHPKVKNLNKRDYRVFFLFSFIKDANEFFEERRRKLVEAGIIPILVQLCKHKSANCREQVSRLEKRKFIIKKNKFDCFLEFLLDFVKMKNIEDQSSLLEEQKYVLDIFFCLIKYYLILSLYSHLLWMVHQLVKPKPLKH